MRPFRLANAWLSTWWPLFVSVAALAVFATMAYTGFTLAEDRALLEHDNEQLAELAERSERDEATRQERLAEAVKLVDDALQARLEAHDADTQFLNNVLLYQIAQLIERPAGVPIDPVTARGLSGPRTSPTPSANGTHRTPTTAAPSPTTATTAPAPTTPAQKNCERRPDGPRC